MNPLQGAISIKDNATVVLRSIRKEQSAFRSDVQKTKAELQRTWDKKYQARLDATAATKAINSLKKKMEPLQKKIVTAAAVKDLASDKVKKISNQIKGVGKLVASPVVKLKEKVSSGIQKVSSKMKAAGKLVATPIIKLKDMVSAGLGKISGKIKSFAKKIVIPVTVAATVATAALGASVSSGMELENQQTSIQHFIGATNKGMDQSQVKAASDSYVSQLRNNANATPFETGEVISAGARAISISEGDSGSAMGMIQLAEDMAAASGGTQSLSSAIEALADAKMGEMERLKSFGFKVSADEFKEKGFEGVSADLQDFFGGAAAKLATTGSGLISTIKGKLKSNVADFGLKVVDKLKPVLQNVITMIDKAGPAIETFGTMIAEKIGSGINFVTGILPTLISGFQAVRPIFDSLAGSFKSIMPQFTKFSSTLLSAVKQIASGAGPLIESFGAQMAQGIGSGLEFLTGLIPSLISGFQSIMPTIVSIIQGFQNIMPQLMSFGGTLMTAIQQVATAAMPVVETIINTVQSVIPSVLPVLETVITTISDVISAAAPIISGLVEGIGTVVSNLAPVFQVIFDGIGEKVGSVLSFVGEKMGWIQEIISAAMPVVSSVLSTAWNVISPIIDIAISVFQALFNVVSTVFNGIVSVVSNVWSVIQPIVDGIANGLSWIADKIGGLFGFGGGGSGSVGTNADGTNNWKGGLTWVGERGPELVELPGGSRILPTKESVNFASSVKNAAAARAAAPASATQPPTSAVSQASGSVIQNTTVINHTSAGAEGSVIGKILSGFSAIVSLFRPDSVPKEPGSVGRPYPMTPPAPGNQPMPPAGGNPPGRQERSFVVNINKLADQLVIRSDEDIDRIGEALARRFVEVAGNMA